MSPTSPATPSRPEQAIQFIDLGAQRRQLGDRLDQAVQRVMAHGKFILGPEVSELETRLADRTGVKHAIGVSSGTDALALVLMAWGLRTGDAVLVPDFTFAATAEVVAWLGATPVFCDVDPATFNLPPDSLEAGIETARAQGLAPKAVIAVDLFGQPADYHAIEELTARHGLKLIADGAQSFGAYYRDRPVGSIGDAATTSFFPAKPLGCYGDGGAVFTDDDALAWQIRSLRVHGQGEDKYDNVSIGMNGRLDAMQAAILLEKLEIFDAEVESRQRVAQRYTDALREYAEVPTLRGDRTSVWAQYTIQVEHRARLAEALQDDGVPTAIYYPKPLSAQPAYRRYPAAGGGSPIAERLAGRVLSLPMHPYLSDDTQAYIIDRVRRNLP